MNTSLCLQMQMKPSPQLVVNSKFLWAGSAELEGMILRELTANPVLENSREEQNDIPPILPEPIRNLQPHTHVRRGSGCYSDRESSDDLFENCPASVSILEQLGRQIRLLASDSCRDLALKLLNYLDERGYLSVEPDQLTAWLAVEPDHFRQALAVLHELEPPGIGAVDARDCLLIQCDYLAEEGYDCRLAQQILCHSWDDFIHKRWQRVAHQANCTKEQVEETALFLRNNCYLYPLYMLDQPDDHLEPLRDPDIIIRRGNGRYFLEIPGEADYAIKFRAEFLSGYDGSHQGSPRFIREECVWVQKYVDRAHLIVNALRQRWETLRRVTQYLLEHQSAFFEGDLQQLKPITRAGVARALGLSESTVSRAVMNKVMQLPNGRLILLRDLFDHSLPIKACIQHILEQVHRPLSDREICDRLQGFGYIIARRTVAKYRSQLNLPGMYQR